MTSNEAYLVAAAQGDQVAVDHYTRLIDAAQATTEERLAAPGALASASLWYAQQGIAVFPCRPDAKRPATLHGLHDATTDPVKVRQWWTTAPDANIGIPTGHRFDVVDVDGPTGTVSFGLADVTEQGLRLLGWVKTPRGFHYYIPPTGAGNRAGLMPGVDYRGLGGYVVAPPSRTPDGHYRWVRPLEAP